MRKAAIVISIILLGYFYLYINRQDVTVIDVHYDGYSAEVLVDRLPFSDSAKITWWKKIRMNSEANIIFLPVNQPRC